MFSLRFDPEQKDRAIALHKKYGWSLTQTQHDQFIIYITLEGLHIEAATGRQKALQIDWTQGQTKPQIQRRFSKKDPWIKSMGEPRANAVLFDATCGFGHDAWVMALRGFTVYAFERNPVVYELAQDAWARLSDEFLEVKRRLKIVYADFNVFCQNKKIVGIEDVVLQQLTPQVVYLDPMYPEQNKTALSKKELRWLREWTQEDVTQDELLFASAQGYRPERLVVKRPLRGECLNGRKPHEVYAGQSTRYDVYFCDRNQ